MAYNLSRNSRVFVTTNLSTASGQAVAAGGNSVGAGQILATGMTTANTWEIQVMDGFKFSQATATTAIQIKEAGATPTRGQRSFNTALNPVDITFSTYIRPRKNSGLATAEERILWNALMGTVGITGTLSSGTTQTVATLAGSPTSITRASAATGLATINGTALAAPTINGVVAVAGDAGFLKVTTTQAGITAFNAPFTWVSFSATSHVIQYMVPPAGTTTTVTPVTAVLVDKAAWVEIPTSTASPTYAALTSAFSNKNQMQAIGFIFLVDNTTYVIDNCALDQAQVDFGLDAIAMVAWTAKGTKLAQVPTASTLTDANAGLDNATVTFTVGTLQGTAQGKVTTAPFITNKLSTVTLKANLGSVSESGGSSYGVVLTGGSISIANGITYVTPNNIGVVNNPIGYFTGTRNISGTMNAYLKTGTLETSTLLTDILAFAATNTDTKFRMQIEVGGASNTTRVEFEMPGAMLGIPSVDVQDVISTAITFNAQSTMNTVNEGTAVTDGYDIQAANDLTVRYFAT